MVGTFGWFQVMSQGLPTLAIVDRKLVNTKYKLLQKVPHWWMGCLDDGR
jgi:hypothetical protein